MRKTFQSEQREYELDSTRIVEFVDSLQIALDEETELRTEGGQRVRPVGLLSVPEGVGYTPIDVSRRNGNYKTREEFYGKTLNIKTEVIDCGCLRGANLGGIVITKDGKTTLTIQPLERLAINPEIVYTIAQKYSK